MVKSAEIINPINEDAQTKTDEHLSENTPTSNQKADIKKILEDPKQIFEEYKEYYPEIYNPDQTEIRSLSKEVTDKVSRKDMLNFIKIACETNMDDAEDFLVPKIASAYGLKNIPYIAHLDADDIDPENPDKGGGFDRYNNIITLYFGENGIDSICDYVEMLSHELWHARQYEMISDGKEKGKLYEKNLKYYIRPQMDKDGYEQQIVEAEAYDIGRILSIKYIRAQYSYLDADDLKELRTLKTKHDIHDMPGLDKAFSNRKINKDDYWLLYFDFMISSYTKS